MKLLFSNLFIPFTNGAISEVESSKPTDYGAIVILSIEKNDAGEYVVKSDNKEVPSALLGTATIDVGSFLRGEVQIGSKRYVSLERLHYAIERIGTEANSRTLKRRVESFKATLGTDTVSLKTNHDHELDDHCKVADSFAISAMKDNRRAFFDAMVSLNLHITDI